MEWLHPLNNGNFKKPVRKQNANMKWCDWVMQYSVLYDLNIRQVCFSTRFSYGMVISAK